MNTILKKKALEIIELAYGQVNEDVKKSYKNFLINLNKKEIKINEKYESRKIEIYNLWRNESELVNSMIIGLAHHVDYCDRGETDNKAHFISIYKKMLHIALDEDYLIFNDLINSGDYKNIKRIRDVLADYWRKDKAKKTIKLEVYNCYSIKNFLKERGFMYNKLSRAWETQDDVNEINNVANIILNMNPYVKVRKVPDNKISINIQALVVASGNTYIYKDILKQEKFYFENGYWKKRIYANEYYNEIKKLKSILPKSQGIKYQLEFRDS